MTDSGFDFTAIRYIPIDEETTRDLSIRERDFFISRGNGTLALVGRGTLSQPPPFACVFPDTMIRIRLVEIDCIAAWISHVWRSAFVRRQIERKAKTSAGIWKVSQPDIESIRIPLAPVNEQGPILRMLAKTEEQQDTTQQRVSAAVEELGVLDRAHLAQAFRGDLVPQDPADEPASVLLDRLRAERAAAPAKKRRGK